MYTYICKYMSAFKFYCQALARSTGPSTGGPRRKAAYIAAYAKYSNRHDKLKTNKFFKNTCFVMFCVDLLSWVGFGLISWCRTQFKSMRPLHSLTFGLLFGNVY